MFPYRWSKRPIENIKWIYYSIINFVERGRNGYGRRDAWNLFDYIGDICIGALTQLKNEGCSYPMDMTPEEWNEKLETMIVGFKAANRISELEYNWNDPKETEEVYNTYNKGMELFCKHFLNLWD